MSAMLQVSLWDCLHLQSFAVLDFMLPHAIILQDGPKQEGVSPGFLWCFSLSVLILPATTVQHRRSVVRINFRI